MNQYSKAGAPASAAGARGIPIEEAGSAKEVAERVRQGTASLEIVSTPWGVEFYVVSAEGSP